MPEFETLTKRELIKLVPSRWRLQYCVNGVWKFNDGRDKTYEALKALDLDSCNEKDIDDVIENESWTRIRCDHCRKEVEKICYLESHSQGEYGSCSYCVDCLRGALKEMEKL